MKVLVQLEKEEYDRMAEKATLNSDQITAKASQWARILVLRLREMESPENHRMANYIENHIADIIKSASKD